MEKGHEMTTYNIYTADGEFKGSIKAANPNTITFDRLIKAIGGKGAKAVKAD